MYNSKKGDLVDNELKNLLVADGTAIDCKYFVNSYSTEFVEVTYSDGSKEEICINCAEITEIASFIKDKGCGDEMRCRFKDIIGECNGCGNAIHINDCYDYIDCQLYCQWCVDELEKEDD